MSDTVIVNKKALQEVLEALIGDSHYIRELQATIHTPVLGDMPPNPIKTLIDEFQNQPKPAWFHAECDDPDCSAFFPDCADALARVSDYGGTVTPLFT